MKKSKILLMSFLKKMSIAFVVLLQVFFLLVSGETVVRADGEKPFVGTIEMIDAGTITVKVIDGANSEWATGDVVTYLITKDTRVVKLINDRLKTVAFERLTVDSPVRITPHTLPNNDVEAGTVEIIRRAEK
jgi:hypothetical protein